MSATQEQKESIKQRQNQIRTMSRKLERKKTKSPELNKIISFIPDSFKKLFIYRHYTFDLYINSSEFRNKEKNEKLIEESRKIINSKTAEKNKIKGKRSEEDKILKEMNDKLNSQNELINIENKKLFNQNYIYLSEIEKYKKQINDFNQIIENKDTLINSLKEKDMINAEKKEESSELSKLKINEKKLKEEKIELNNKVNELNLK